jgi:glucosyl-3-phosphoglycerate synthase
LQGIQRPIYRQAERTCHAPVGHATDCSLQSIIGQHDFLVYLDTFRYPLSGEMSLDHDIIRRARIPADWASRSASWPRCFGSFFTKEYLPGGYFGTLRSQASELSSRDATKGLNKMAVDIVKSLFLTLAGHGVKLDRGIFDTLLSAYAQGRGYHAILCRRR